MIVHPKPDIWTELHDVPVPLPRIDEIVIKVVVAGSNVKGLLSDFCLQRGGLTSPPLDWLHPTLLNVSLNSGDDIAGIVHSIGSDVSKTNEFRIGDRVAAFHPMMTPHGAFAAYATAPAHTVFKIPTTISFEGSWHKFLVVSEAG